MGQENLNFEDGARYLRIPPFGDRRLINGQQGGGKEWLSNTYFLEDDVGGEPATNMYRKTDIRCPAKFWVAIVKSSNGDEVFELQPSTQGPDTKCDFWDSTQSHRFEIRPQYRNPPSST
eukprot:scaffold11506_cov151-Amphora_coffeaeformis.AAC.5